MTLGDFPDISQSQPTAMHTVTACLPHETISQKFKLAHYRGGDAWEPCGPAGTLLPSGGGRKRGDRGRPAHEEGWDPPAIFASPSPNFFLFSTHPLGGAPL